MKDRCPRCNSKFEKKSLRKLYADFKKSGPKRKAKSHKFVIKCPKCNTFCIPKEKEIIECVARVNNPLIFYVVSLLTGIFLLCFAPNNNDSQLIGIFVFLTILGIAALLDNRTTGFLTFEPYKPKIK